jgi:hypothetical protein
MNRLSRSKRCAGNLPRSTRRRQVIVRLVRAQLQRRESWLKSPQRDMAGNLAERGLSCLPTGRRCELTEFHPLIIRGKASRCLPGHANFTTIFIGLTGNTTIKSLPKTKQYQHMHSSFHNSPVRSTDNATLPRSDFIDVINMRCSSRRSFIHAFTVYGCLANKR